jgi:nicotinate phosphoribosyltransferase
MAALNTDLYQLTMAAGYFAARKTDELATFEISVRRLPEQRNFLIAAGLEQAVEYLLKLRFEREEIEYLRTLRQFSKAPAEFFDYLLDLRFTGELHAVPEGTVVFPNEPLAIIRAPLIEAQIVETYLLSTFAFQTLIASKAIRCVLAAEGRPVVEFGSRRAHGPDAGILAGRAAYIAGCLGTSNAEAGMRFGIPVFGTAAHAWTMAFPSEEESFRALQELLGDATIFLVDTYDTVEGTELAAQIGNPLWGVRLDSGDLVALSRQARRIFDDAGLKDSKIFVTNDLNEYKVAEMVAAGAPIDAFGIGTQLATSFDAPALSAVYKMVELRRGNEVHYTAKFSDEKKTLPGAKQIYRFADHDVVTLSTECSADYAGAEPLLRPVLHHGSLLEPCATLDEARARAADSVAGLPGRLRSLAVAEPFRVHFSNTLTGLADSLRTDRQLART